MKKFYLRFLCILILCSTYCTKLFGQQPVYRLLDYAADLPSNLVYGILQDSKGYIWIGHDKGLSRYNGSEFRHFSNNMVQSRALSNLNEDADGNIWCQNFSGDIFVTKGNTLEHFSALKSEGNFVPFSIFNKTKIVTTRKGKIVVYDIKSGKITNPDPKNNSYLPSNILTTANSYYTLGAFRNKLVRFKAEGNGSDVMVAQTGGKIVHFITLGSKLYLFPKLGKDMAFVYENGILVKQMSLNQNTIIQNATVIDNEIWLSTTEGVFRLDTYLNVLHNGRPYFPELNVSNIIKDHEGTLWLSTLNTGVAIVPNLAVRIIYSGIGSITAASYFSSTDRIILGTSENNIYEFDPASQNFRKSVQLDIKHDINSIYNDISNDMIWLSSDKMYGLKGANISPIVTRTYSMKDMVFLGGTTYAMAASDGINLFSYAGDTVQNYYSKLLNSKGPPWVGDRQMMVGGEGRAKCVAFNHSNNTLYASNFLGLFYWSPNGYGIIKDANRPIYASDILAKGNKIYAVTYGGDLYIIEGQKIVKSVKGFKGLEKKSITTIESYGDNLWLVYENAIVKYNIFSNQYRVIRASSGLPFTEIKDIAINNNMVYLATAKGLVYFPENIKSPSLIPRMLLEDVYVNKSLAKINKNGVFDLKTSENNIEIYYAVLSFKSNRDISIYYNINQKEWIKNNEKSRMLKLAGLSPGTYTIQLKAVRSDGQEQIAPVSLKFRIAAPIWSRWWFILLILIVISVVSWSFMRFRINELRRDTEFKTARDRLERELQLSTLASIKSQMNPHFVFNALNTVQAYIFTNDRDNASDYLNKFSDLTRMILDMSNKEKVTLSEEIKALHLYLDLERKRFEDTIDFEIVINENIAPELLSIPAMLIQPYVENAIKHALLHKKGERKLKIEFVMEDSALVVFVDDNGIGRKKSQELKAAKPSSHRSFASEANKKRLQLLNQGKQNPIDIEYLDKVDSYGNSLGTMVILAIPLNF